MVQLRKDFPVMVSSNLACEY
jgi:hypothetical protein